jgi:hypothetical protein
MTDYITKEWFEKKVSQTDDGKASVLNLIKNAITGRGVNQVWARLKEQHPEVLDLVFEVRFPDSNGIIKGKPTPAVDLEGWLQILPLLPGAAGKKYRKDTAELVVRIWKGDADLGLAIMLRDTDKKRLERAKARMRVGDFNIKTRDESYKNGEKPNLVHDARYRGVYDMNTGMVRDGMELSKNDCPLDYMETGELAIHEATQYMALKAMKTKGGTLQGNTFKAGRQMRNAYVETVGTPPTLTPASETIYMDLNDARAISASHSTGQGSLF